MADPATTPAQAPDGATGVVVFADGRVAWGQGFGAQGEAVGELCFNTAMTGYQEVMTDPSYARQVVAFTFPHIGNVGANAEDVEARDPHALGCIVREPVTDPSSFRSESGFASWMRDNGRIGIAGLDTRALTRLVRKEGPPTIVIATWQKTSAASSSRNGAAASGSWAPAIGSAETIPHGRMSSPSITAPSATYSATWSKPAPR